ncbi:MAG TPA: ATPase P, partial [Clostridiales bacterium]|nr:ATPase P [Clostridiales bacterium]
MMITVVLSANMKKMLKDNVLVRKLVGIETAGSLNILFTDKTGTLTKGKLQVTSFITGDGKQYDNLGMLRKHPNFMQDVVTACAFNTDSAISGVKQKTVIGGNGTDKALLTYVLPFIDEFNNARLISHQPFNSKNKFSSSVIMHNGMKKLLMKGAPEIILPKCQFYLSTDGKKIAFNRQNLAVKMKELAEKAMRILALAQSDSENGALTLIGIVGIRDEIRPEAKKAVAEIMSAGIQTVMITGDNKETAVAIAKEIGLITNRESSVFTSQELAHMSDMEIKKILRNIRVVARALPSDKSRLVGISQQIGLVAGMTGDGINDAPALKKADVGFAMGSGTEVAKEAGDIVIIDDNIGSIAKAILYGRTIFKSIRKFIIFQLTMNLCAVGLSVICPFLGIDAPLTVMQMLWINMIMDTLAGLAFSGEAPLKEYMKEPPKKRGEEIINRYMYSEILFTGMYSIIICLIFLKLPLIQNIFHFNDGSHYYMTAFFTLFIFLGVFNSFNTRTYRMNLLSHILRNKLFIFVMILICVVQIFLIYFGGTVFRTHGIEIGHLSLILLIAVTVIPVDLIRKILIRSVGRKGFIIMTPWCETQN